MDTPGIPSGGVVIISTDSTQTPGFNELHGPTPATAGNVPYWVAAQKIRKLIREAERIVKGMAETQALSATYRDGTDMAFLDLEARVGSRTKVSERRAAVARLRMALQQERNQAAEAALGKPQKFAAMKVHVDTIHALAQHLPTQSDIPVGRDANTVRAIKAIMKPFLLHGDGDPQKMLLAVKTIIDMEGGEADG